MNYEVRVSQQASSYFYRLLDRRTQRIILGRLAQIASAPYGRGTKPVSNADRRRTAVAGSWRVIFAVDDQARLVNVSAIRPRRGLYGPLGTTSGRTH